MKKPRVYFAHPELFKVPGREIETQLKRAGFEVFNPFRGPAQWAWDNHPCLETAKRVWHVDFGAILDSDALLAWVPEPSTGVAMEIYAGLFLFPKRVYIVANGYHPFLVASERTFPTIDEAVEQMKRDFEIGKNKTRFLEKTPLMELKQEDELGLIKEYEVKNAIKKTWALVNKAEARLNAVNVSGKDKIRWAQVLASALSTLDKLIWKIGWPVWIKEEKEDLAQILSKVSLKKIKPTPRGVGGLKERGIKELIAETWALIDQTKKSLSDPELKENDRIRWAGVLASAIGTLNHLLWKAGAGKVDEEDLASILSKVPEKYAKMVKRRLKGNENPDFEGIGRGDLVEVVWLDASLSRGISKISNRVVATYKRTVGRFVGIFKDRQYQHPHVLIQHEIDEGGIIDVSSVPLGIVVGVKKLAEKEASKRMKNGASVSWTSPLEGGGTKIITRKVRKC